MRSSLSVRLLFGGPEFICPDMGPPQGLGEPIASAGLQDPLDGGLEIYPMPGRAIERFYPRPRPQGRTYVSALMEKGGRITPFVSHRRVPSHQRGLGTTDSGDVENNPEVCGHTHRSIHPQR